MSASRPIFFVVIAALAAAACVARARAPLPQPLPAHWVQQSTGTSASLRGLSAVSRSVVWASGSGGVYLRTLDGGATWRADTVPGATHLDFRDVQGIDANTAYLLSAGEGPLSRIYKTNDGGRSWTMQFLNQHPRGFFDGMAFWDADNGIAFSDPVDGRFLVITTSDGGMSWRPVAPERIPPALPGEAAFAASGTGIVVQGRDNVWFGTGGGAVARVFRSSDRGRSWTVATTPMPAGNSAGIFSLAFRDERNGVAVGGDYLKPGDARSNVLVTRDGGQTWAVPRGTPPAGYRSAVAYLSGGPMLIAVGTSGSDYSTDGGANWVRLDSVAYNTVSVARGSSAAWAVGPRGRIGRFAGTMSPPR